MYLKLESDLELTFYLQDDWLRLHQSGADRQSAAVLPSVRLLHLANAEKDEGSGQCAALSVRPAVGPAHLISDS